MGMIVKFLLKAAAVLPLGDARKGQDDRKGREGTFWIWVTIWVQHRTTTKRVKETNEATGYDRLHGLEEPCKLAKY